MIDNVKIKKAVSQLTKKSKADAKRETCYICETPTKGFCNSHIVPQFILRKIAVDSELIQSTALAGLEDVEAVKGVKNSGTFHFICNNCDSHMFSEYESPEHIANKPSNKLLAQIALKNYRMQISKRMFEKQLYSNIQGQFNALINKEEMDIQHDLDLRDYEWSYRRAKKILDKGLKSGYKIVHWEILPYCVPLAVQTPIALSKDLNGNTLVDVYDFSENMKIREIHLCVFPLGETSVVILFYHKDDGIYSRFEKQFIRLDPVKKLEYINYIVFKYTESFFVSKKISSTVLTDEKLAELCQEVHGDTPNFGVLTAFEIDMPYESVKPNEIPNLLSKEFSVTRDC